MTTTPRNTAVVLILAAAATGAAGKDQPIRLDIAPGKGAEVCMPLAEGDTLHWRFRATAALDFNLHHHIDKQVLMPVARKSIEADVGEHAIDRRNDWCLMWTAPAEGQRVAVDGAWSALPRRPANKP